MAMDVSSMVRCSTIDETNSIFCNWQVVTTDCKLKPYLLSIRAYGVYSCENIVLWRGHFNATGAETSVNFSITGGSGM